MPLRPPCREVTRTWQEAGVAEVSQTGSHATFVKATEQEVRTAIVPCHREAAAGRPRSILAQAGLSPDELDAL